MFKNLRIGLKLAILVSLLSAAMVLVGLIGLHAMQAGDASIETIYNDRVVCLGQLKIVSDSFAIVIPDALRDVQNASTTRDAAVQAIDAAVAAGRQQWKDYTDTYETDEEVVIIKQVQPLLERAEANVAQVRNLITSGATDELATFVTKTLAPSVRPLIERLSALSDLQLRVVKELYGENQTLYDSSRRHMLVLTGGALLFGLLASVAIIRSITGPIGVVRHAIERMAKGDLAIDIVDDGRRDEAGEMVRATVVIADTLRAVAADLREMIAAARAGTLSSRADASKHPGEFAALVQGTNELVETLAAPLFEVASVMARLAAGDVRRRMSGAYEGDLRALKGNVNRSLDALVALLDAISAFAVALAAGDLTHAIDGSYQGEFAAIQGNLDRAGAQLRGVLMEVVGTTEQVAVSAAQTTEAAVDVARQATTQMTTLADVSSAISQTVAAIAEIAHSAERGSMLARTAAEAAGEGRARLGRLSEAVHSIAARNARITQISDLIGNIADKTYVLALNAGLEALRAGEHGQGFGLIAHKISSLAEEVAQATREIRGLVEEAAAGVNDGVVAAAEAATSMTRIVEVAEQSGMTVQSIAAAIDEQNTMAQMLRERVMDLRMVGQTTAGAAEEISTTMASLSQMAQLLKGETGRLRTA